MLRRRYNTKPHYHRLYGTKQWKALRAHQLDTEPLCAYCLQMGKAEPADTVDHIKPHRGNEALFYDSKNLQSMCKECHDSAKHKEEVTGKTIGCDPNGLPNDKSHPWYG